MTIYVDADHRCHVTDDGTMTAVDEPLFDGKCSAFIKGYCCEISDNQRDIYPWKPTAELAIAQAQYEADMAELEAAYREGVNSV